MRLIAHLLRLAILARIFVLICLHVVQALGRLLTSTKLISRAFLRAWEGLACEWIELIDCSIFQLLPADPLVVLLLLLDELLHGAVLPLGVLLARQKVELLSHHFADFALV